MKILVLGGTGKLGRLLCNRLKKRDIDFIAPTRRQCNLLDLNESYFKGVDLVIHSAGSVNTLEAENNPDEAIEVNVQGTSNVVKKCRELDLRLIFISSEYVFAGDNIPYTTSSLPNPKNIYGVTKACGELLTKTLNNYVIVRAPFIRETIFNYDKAFSDQYTCRQYVHEILDDIIDVSIGTHIGIVHIVGKYQSVYELALKTKQDVTPINVPNKMRSILPLYLNLK